eukprot:6233725-Pyramimonas_sp.AAC.1
MAPSAQDKGGKGHGYGKGAAHKGGGRDTRPASRARFSDRDIRQYIQRVPPMTKEEAAAEQLFRQPPETSAEQHQFRPTIRQQLTDFAILALTARRAKEHALADMRDKKIATRKCMAQSTMSLRQQQSEYQAKLEGAEERLAN